MYDEAINSYQSLPPLERAHLFAQIIRDGSSASAIARKIGKSLAYVSNTLRLLKLPHFVQDGLNSNTISEGHARALLSIHSEPEMMRVYKEVLITNSNVRQTEELVRKAEKRYIFPYT